jgi:translation initiation factor 2B subunit (eIF-2B alpha/beta/delta family)
MNYVEPHEKLSLVNHPKHYQGNGIEVIDIIEAFELNFSLGNAIKYILRADKKGNKKQDLEKAIWYLNNELNKFKG